MRIFIQSIILGSIGLLVGCTENANVRAMIPAQMTTTSRTGQPVQAAVINGTARNEVLPNIQREDFKQALEMSLVRSRMFTSVGGDGFRVEAFITSIRHSRVGEKLRVEMEVRYAVRRRSLVVLRKLVRSTYEVPMNEVMEDLVRVREATKGAARENIGIFIRLLDKQRL